MTDSLPKGAKAREAAALILAMAAASFPAGASVGPPRSPTGDPERPVVLVDVPFVPQTESLCGAAAVAMAMRYWGALSVLAEDFEDLELDTESGSGISTGALVGGVRGRGWQAFPLSQEREDLLRTLTLGRPPIVLLETRPERFHYVVVVGHGNGRWLLHDPALGPWRVVEEERFLAAWDASKRWTLLVLPPPAAREGTSAAASPDSAAASADSAAVSVDPCEALLAEGVRCARSGDLDGAEGRLAAAAALCPRASRALTELAGLRFRRDDWEGAAVLAERALAQDRSDTLTWRILATSRFLRDDLLGALEAWNAIAEPRIDLLRIDGLERTHYRAVADHLGLPAGRLLTRQAFHRAARRLNELPGLSRSRLSYRPLPGGAVRVEAFLQERPLLPRGPLAIASLGTRAAIEREIQLQLSGATGQGDLWSARWRWWERRPRIEAGLAIPAALGLRAVWRVTGFFERETHRPGDDSGRLIEVETRGFRLSASDWARAWLPWEGRIGLDRWGDLGSFVAFGGRVAAASYGERLSLSVDASGWTPLSGSSGFTTAGARLRGGSSGHDEGLRATAQAGFYAASPGAPRLLWPGAGAGHAREPLLRAHPLLEDGVISGKAFGRSLWHAQVEGILPLLRWTPVRLEGAAFLDAARAWAGEPESGSLVDCGAGLRLRGPRGTGQLRADLAWGLADRASAFSIAWQSF